MLAIPEIVNPANPPKMPSRLPPRVALSTNTIAVIIVPNAPATAAFHSPHIAPEWAMYPVMNQTISNPTNSYCAKNDFTKTANMKPTNTALHLVIISPFNIII